MSVSRIEISLRRDDVGGEVRTKPEASDDSALRAARHLVLLIHGYNNNRLKAVEAYKGFHDRQHDQDPADHYGSDRKFVELYWPGDAAWGIASFLFYMGSIDRARESATVLGGYLAECFQNDQVRIDIVAHSMGCRLALELLQTLAVHPQLQIARIVFMAAAVPTFMLEGSPPGRLRSGYNAVIHEGARSLYSSDDRVLAFAFPLGQTLAGDGEGFVPTALGHEYWVSGSVPFNLGQAENTGAGHGDYWGGGNPKPRPLSCARAAAREVRDYLRFTSAGDRSVSVRPLMESSALEARAIAEKREIAAREVLSYGG